MTEPGVKAKKQKKKTMSGDFLYDFDANDLDPKLQDIGRKKRCFEYKKTSGANPAVKRTSIHDASCVYGVDPGKPRANPMEQGITAGPNDNNKKINDQTINVGWGEVAGWKNVLIGVGAVLFAGWVIKQ